MRKNIILVGVLAFGTFTAVNAQTGRVGINTDTPQSTLDVRGKRDADGKSLTTDMTGLQAPRLTREELTLKGNTFYGSNQKGALIYITDVSLGTAISQRVNVTIPGYYYFDGAFWQKFVDTDTAILPTGFERRPDMTATNFYWRLIGADATKYGTEGKYGLDATWNPSDFNETVNAGGTPITYNTLMNLGYLSTSDLGARGKNSFTSGAVNSASGNISTALGAGNASIGDGSFAAGLANHSEGHLSAAIGRENWALGIASFAAGNGNRIEATGASSVAMGVANIVNGENAVAMGQQNEVTAQGTVAIGNTNTASAVSALAMGQKSNASGQASLAIGTENTASGQNAVAIGRLSNASGSSSIAIGTTSNSSSGLGSVSIGNNTVAQSAYTTAMGLFNTLETSPEPLVVSDATKRLFVIGNGNATTRSDAFTILRNGKTGIGESIPTNRLHVKDSANPLRLEGLQGTVNPKDLALVVDANGVVKTSDLQKTKFGGYIDFPAGSTTSQTIAIPATNGIITKVRVTNEQVDNNDEYDTTTGFFTPKETGVYTWEFAMTYRNDAAVEETYGLGADRGVIGIVDTTTDKWISRAAYEASNDDRFFLAKGVVTLTAGKSYYFGASGPTNKTLTIVTFASGATGNGIGTYFDFTRIK